MSLRDGMVFCFADDGSGCGEVSVTIRVAERVASDQLLQSDGRLPACHQPGQTVLPKHTLFLSIILYFGKV